MARSSRVVCSSLRICSKTVGLLMSMRSMFIPSSRQEVFVNVDA